MCPEEANKAGKRDGRHVLRGVPENTVFSWFGEKEAEG